eukprot:Pgem_evm1s10360
MDYTEVIIASTIGKNGLEFDRNAYDLRLKSKLTKTEFEDILQIVEQTYKPLQKRIEQQERELFIGMIPTFFTFGLALICILPREYSVDKEIKKKERACHREIAENLQDYNEKRNFESRNLEISFLPYNINNNNNVALGRD